MVSEKELIFYILLGLLAAGAATLFVRTLSAFEDRFDAWKFPEPFKPVIGGLAVGLIGVWLPQVFGSGLPQMEQVLLIHYPFVIMLLLVPAKVLATSLTLGSGGSGGVFAPSLFIGGMLGGAFGHIVHSQFPSFTALSGAYAIVGMAAVFGAAAQAPLTAILIIFEMTGDYRIILPLMAATVVAASVYRAFNSDSIYTVRLTKRGIVYRGGQDMDIMASTRVAAALTHRLLTVPPDMLIRDFQREMERTNHTWFPVVNGAGVLVGIISRAHVLRAYNRELLRRQAR